MKKAGLVLIGFLSLAAVIGLVVTRPFGGEGLGTGAGRALSSRAPTEPGTLVKEASGDAAAIGSSEAAPAALDQLQSVTSELPGLPPLGQAVVKTAELSIEVRKGGFASAFDQASLVASSYGGYVESSSMTGAQAKTGSIVIRVPSARFDQAMADLRGLGSVKRESISGQVVTQDFVDLEARLRTWESQEAVLLKLMDEATSVESTLRIQRELQDVQFRIEQIKGQLRVLEDQTQLATIHVSLREPGAPVPVPTANETTRLSLGEAWERAIDGIVGVAYVTIVGLGYLVPITLLALVVWFAYRRFARRAASTGVPA
jgi:Domain of unknown function (DUF4349)